MASRKEWNRITVISQCFLLLINICYVISSRGKTCSIAEVVTSAAGASVFLSKIWNASCAVN